MLRASRRMPSTWFRGYKGNCSSESQDAQWMLHASPWTERVNLRRESQNAEDHVPRESQKWKKIFYTSRRMNRNRLHASPWIQRKILGPWELSKMLCDSWNVTDNASRESRNATENAPCESLNEKAKAPRKSQNAWGNTPRESQNAMMFLILWVVLWVRLPQRDLSLWWSQVVVSSPLKTHNPKLSRWGVLVIAWVVPCSPTGGEQQTTTQRICHIPVLSPLSGKRNQDTQPRVVKVIVLR